VHFKGEISAEESLVIEGSFEGKINQKDRNLTVGKKGQVNAEIHAKTIEVRGRVDGDLYATEVIRLFATSTVNGNIFCKRIVMDDGAVFNGTFDMSLNGKKAANGKLVIADDSANDSETIAQVAV
jgi:cytoskeletal protein CcmA (bactofilin family)